MGGVEPYLMQKLYTEDAEKSKTLKTLRKTNAEGAEKSKR
jgi:hypothetical protein